MPPENGITPAQVGTNEERWKVKYGIPEGMPDPELSVSLAARILDLSNPTIRSLLKHGILRSLRHSDVMGFRDLQLIQSVKSPDGLEAPVFHMGEVRLGHFTLGDPPNTLTDRVQETMDHSAAASQRSYIAASPVVIISALSLVVMTGKWDKDSDATPGVFTPHSYWRGDGGAEVTGGDGANWKMEILGKRVDNTLVMR